MSLVSCEGWLVLHCRRITEQSLAMGISMFRRVLVMLCFVLGASSVSAAGLKVGMSPDVATVERMPDGLPFVASIRVGHSRMSKLLG